MAVPEPPEMKTISACYLLADNQGRLWAGLWGGPQLGVVLCRENGKWTKYGPEEWIARRLYQQPRANFRRHDLGWNVGRGIVFISKTGNSIHLRMTDGLSDDAICALFVDRQQNLVDHCAFPTASTGSARKNFRSCRVLENSSERLPISIAQTTNGECLLPRVWARDLPLWSDRCFDQLLRDRASCRDICSSAHCWAHRTAVCGGARGRRCFNGRTACIFRITSANPGCGATVFCPCARTATVECGLGPTTASFNYCKMAGSPVAGLPEKPVTALAQEPDGTLWIGSMGGGLARLQNGKLSVFTTKDGLRSNLIRALQLDARGTLWIRTISGGLARWANGRFASFTTQQGLIDDTILQIIDDDSGNLWLGCNRGICRVNKQSLEDLADGKSRFPCICWRLEIRKEWFLNNVRPTLARRPCENARRPIVFLHRKGYCHHRPAPANQQRD